MSIDNEQRIGGPDCGACEIVRILDSYRRGLYGQQRLPAPTIEQIKEARESMLQTFRDVYNNRYFVALRKQQFLSNRPDRPEDIIS